MPRRRLGLRVNLLLLVLAALVPIGLLGCGVLLLYWRDAQNAQESFQRQTVNELAAGVDAQIDSTIKRLALLADDALLKPATMAAFYQRCKVALGDSPDWLNIALVAADRKQIFTLNEPYGKRGLDLAGRAHVETALQTR